MVAQWKKVENVKEGGQREREVWVTGTEEKGRRVDV
jgi:hypothetical protein